MPILEYRQATKDFGQDRFAVEDVSFAIQPGELVVLTGHTGSGKTTLLKLLTREYTLTSGEIYFNDTPVHNLKGGKINDHRRRIGVVYQDYRLIREMNVWENIALPLYIDGRKEQEIEQRVSDLLNLIKLPQAADMFPSQLSGGEAQRVSIARSLALAPELIFADEPTGNLDTDTSKVIAAVLQKINELGTTVLIASHDITVLDLFEDERNLHMEGGKLIEDIPAKNTKSSTTTSTAAPDKRPAKTTEEDKKNKKSDSEGSTIPEKKHEKVDEKPVASDKINPKKTSTVKDEEPTKTNKDVEKSEEVATKTDAGEPQKADTKTETDAPQGGDAKTETKTAADESRPPEKKPFWHKLKLGKK